MYYSLTMVITTFVVVLVEKVNYSKQGVYEVRAKGDLIIHGVTKERIIKATLKVLDKSVNIRSDFELLLSDHDIRIPRVVNQKLSENVQVKVDVDMSK